MNAKNTSRRQFIKLSAAGGSGMMIGAMGFSKSSYGRILGANDRVNVGVVGFSDRFRTSLLPSFASSAKELNFDMIAVSDIWNRRRREGTSIIAEKNGHSVKACVNNEELYNNKEQDAEQNDTADSKTAQQKD